MEQIIPDFSIFLLIFMRVSAFFVTIPLFSYRTIPMNYRIGLALLLAILMQYSLDIAPIAINGNYFLLIIKEATVGLFIGLFAYIIVNAIQIAGGFIDFQMGFAIANVIDPQTGAQSPLMGQYLYIFSLLFLFAVNGHHLLLDGIFYSYQFIPINQLFIPFGDEQLIGFIIQSFSTMFLIALQIAIPVVASLFLVDVTLGIIARTVPQINIFVVGFPIKIAVSFIVLSIVLVVMFQVVSLLFESMLHAMRVLMELMGGIA